MDVRADRFPLVDSLRAIAALAIVAFHAGLYAGVANSTSIASRIVANLQVGVPIFFLISGFLLYRPFARARLEGVSAPRTGAYAWRRFLRIVPAYWVALTLAAVVGVAGSFTLWHAPVYYGFAQIYRTSTYAGGLGQAWTLCVEVTFYAMLPLWALAMRALPTPRTDRAWLRQELAALAALFAFSVAYKAIVALSMDLNSFEAQPFLMVLPNFCDQFAVGMGIAVVSLYAQRAERPVGVVRALDAHAWVSWAVAAAALAVVCAGIGITGKIGDPLTRTTFMLRHELWTVVALGLVLPAMLGDFGRGLPRRVLALRPLAFLGLVSYGVFLQHLTWMLLLQRWGFHSGWAGWLAVGGAGAIALGAASYYLVERPALSLKDLVPARGRDTAQEALAEPAPVTPP
jgi:peptidoglycan/LPS O-acetylase OafA/YrhL